MYFIFEIAFSSDKQYVTELIRAYKLSFGMDVEIIQANEKIWLLFEQDDERIEKFLTGLEEILPASIYFGTSRHYFAAEKPKFSAGSGFKLPLNISLCPRCQKEMFDVSSPRYYYPFTSCNSCGGQVPFVTGYPYNRTNSSMKFIVPCKNCEKELSDNPFRKDYPLISCIDCGISVKMNDGKSERYANDKGSYRKLFEVSAGAIAKGKSVVIKTLNGYRRFFKPDTGMSLEHTILLINDAAALNKHLMMVTQEFNALLSIERPVVRVSTKSETMKALYGTTALVKYPDDGMTMLLARELLNAGMEYVVYEMCDRDSDGDFLVDFDIPIEPQKDIALFINQDTYFFISGERCVFPSTVNMQKDVVSIAHGLVAMQKDNLFIIDSLERQDDVATSQVNILSEENISSGHSNEKSFEQWEASMASVLAEHNAFGEKALGIHFDDSLYFLYYNGKKVIKVIPPNPFEAHQLFEHISSLREGSDRLVINYEKAYPDTCKRLKNLSGNVDIFMVAAIMLGLSDESFEGISAEALSFLGKGGIQIDTHVKDNRFDNYAFLASIMSYQLGMVENVLMCYSIFESFGDYISEIVSQLAEKTEAKNITFSGETFANQALYARIQRHMGRKNLLFPKNYPIGKECAVHGGIYL